jgi:hypothetical protein
LRQLLGNFINYDKPEALSRFGLVRLFMETGDGAMTTAMARYSTPPAFSISNDRFWSYNIETSSQKGSNLL